MQHIDTVPEPNKQRQTRELMSYFNEPINVRQVADDPNIFNFCKFISENGNKA